MKTAISIPDAVFERGERLKRRLRKSRSQLYAEALADYMLRHDSGEVTESWNRVCDEAQAGVDPPLHDAALRVLEADGMVISQGDVLWADLPAPVGSGPGYRRPVVVLQGDALNRSRIATVLCVPLTSNLRLAEAAGNVLLRARFTSLQKDSVANLSQLVALDRRVLNERVGHLDRSHREALLAGLDIVLGRLA